MVELIPEQWEKIRSSFSYGALTDGNKPDTELLDHIRDSRAMITPRLTTETKEKRLSQNATWKAGQPLSAVHAYNSKQLLSQNPAGFKYLNSTQKEALKQDLLLAHQNFCLRYQFFEIENHHQGLNLVDIYQCEHLIEQLEFAIKEKDCRKLRDNWTKEKAQLILDQKKHHQWTTGKAEALLEKVGLANSWRLYWVWTGLMVRTGLENGYWHHGHSEQALYAARYPKFWMDLASYDIYYFRGLINLFFALKHTLPLPWMSDQEKEIVNEKGGWSRLYEQLAERKFKLLNDFLWATSNLLGAVKFIGGTPLGLYGDILTVILLVMDYELAQLGFSEALQQQNQDLQQYNNEILVLQQKRITLLEKQNKSQQDIDNIDILEDQVKRLIHAKNLFTKEWDEKSFWYHSQKISIAYSAALIVAFVILVFPWEHFITALGYAAETAVASAATFAFTGAALLFILSWAQTSYQAYLDVSRARMALKDALTDCLNIVNNKKEIKNAEYLNYLDLRQQAEYQKQLIQYQFASFTRTSLLQLGTPGVIYGAFTFATMGVGCGILLAWLAIATISHFKVEALKPSSAPDNNSECDDFKKFNTQSEQEHITKELEDTSYLSRTLGLFSSTRDKESTEGTSLLEMPLQTHNSQ